MWAGMWNVVRCGIEAECGLECGTLCDVELRQSVGCGMECGTLCDVELR